MKTFVISLSGDDVRRSFMRRQLDALGIDYEFFDAIRGSERIGDLRWYDDVSVHHLEGRSLRPGEVGCALSHTAAYAEIVKRSLPWALILEDDAVLHRDLPNVLSVIERGAGAQGQLISLSRCDAYLPWTKKHLFGAFAIVTPWLVKEGSIAQAVGYVISLKAAEAMVEINVPVKFPADSWGHYCGIVEFKGVIPTLTLVTQNVDLGSTTLESGKRQAFTPYSIKDLLLHGFTTYNSFGRFLKRSAKHLFGS
ncbi:MAG: glycosyltransferase family 25 protein [Rectinema sp.]